LLLKDREGHKPPDELKLVHGHFLNIGKESAVVVAFWHESGGDSMATFLFSKETSGWSLHSRYDSLNVAYCRVFRVSAKSDTLICQTNYAGPSGQYGTGEIHTNLYAVDFTKSPDDSWFLDLRDTVSSGAQCLSWANVKSLRFADDSLHTQIEYGRMVLPPDQKAQNKYRKRAEQFRGSPPDFPHRLYEIEFRVFDGKLAPADGSKKNIAFVTSHWETDSCRSLSNVGQGH
jgi:hypothetical protein